MVEETTIHEIATTVYIATDGEVFTGKSSCLHHEWRLAADFVFVLYIRGSRSEVAEIYSTERLAKEAATGDINRYTIAKVYIDERTYSVNANNP